ncbi:glycosyl transferase family 2 [Vagococcus entomophilus]|uniref:Glycosyltransferase 2-like domain-containing protein n=1 Tax=Vagococcus entomophilus TaxID=1160095 RepID=A0A430AIR0_9ENTE|nr:glycosyl transferase family 2 [Vagococcus entomophilus]RSU07893.1 hypothetical protein CBF30_01245 [Vagococcus entomophilus]
MNALFVIVLYNTPLSKCESYASLIQSLAHVDFHYSILIYDNSPLKQLDIQLDTSCSYQHNPDNPGTAAAYNYALNQISESNDTWLILLDQDTQVTTEFIVQGYIQQKKLSNQIVAMIPRIYSDSRQISPTESDTLQAIHHPILVSGTFKENLTAIASGTWIRSSFLHSINGFSPLFPLDYLDHWLFFEIFNQKMAVLILDTTLSHDLSVLSMNQVSLERYQNILDSEHLYYSKYRRNLHVRYKAQLLLRFFKQLLTVRNKKIAYHTFLFLFK